jgi:DNA-binding response OmpR family regulator
MLNEPSSETRIVSIADVCERRRQAGRQKPAVRDVTAAGPFSYRMKLGRETIRLNPIEYRILSFLAAKPYRAYTRQRIADAVSTELHPVGEATLDRHIASLRQKLGFFFGYIQRVPYIGYRFKA